MEYQSALKITELSSFEKDVEEQIWNGHVIEFQLHNVWKRRNYGDGKRLRGFSELEGREMATHSSILAWKVPWTEEPGGLQSMGSQSWTQLSD